MELSPDILNEALKAFIKTVPFEDQLNKHIDQKGLQQHREKITEELFSLRRTAEDILYDYPGGVPWTKEFEKEYRVKIEEKHPWIKDEGFDRVISFSGWLCWHEGLNANPRNTEPGEGGNSEHHGAEDRSR